MHEILTTRDMYEADRRAIAGGVTGLELMENAGQAVAARIFEQFPIGKIAVLCGPGNNGGDGFVIARVLKKKGWRVALSLLGELAALKGDAAAMAKKWDGPVYMLTQKSPVDADVIVDAIFGAGLARDIEGDLAAVIETTNQLSTPVIAVDVPSGIDGSSGKVLGIAIKAQECITFFRRKTGHMLMPGRAFCGALTVVDIGIPDDVIAGLNLPQIENTKDLWHPHFPQHSVDSHKYSRGAVVVVSGPASQTGAARLAARGALRAGAGVVTIASLPAAVLVNACQLTAIMVKRFDSAVDLHASLANDRRTGAVVIGPGAGYGDNTRNNVRAVLDAGMAVILDADALTSFENRPDDVFDAIKEHPDRSVVMTPHDGEFMRLFGDIGHSFASKVERARHAANLSGAIIVYKGSDSVIAEPGGRVAINMNAPATLATAGSGDVLSGIIAALVAQNMPAFYAACAGVWLHGEAAVLFGVGLIAEDIPELLPKVLQKLAAEDE